MNRETCSNKMLKSNNEAHKQKKLKILPCKLKLN